MEARGDRELVIASRGAWKAGPVAPRVAAQADGRVFSELLLPHIRKACDHSGGRFTPAGCIERWVGGQWEMWAVNDPANECVAVAFTQVNEYPDTGLRTMEIVLMGGVRMKAWVHLEPTLLAHARANDCQRLEAWSRSGLSNMLPHWGRSFLIERDVDDARVA